MVAKVKTAKDVAAGDIWAGKSSDERLAWLKKAECEPRWYTTTFDDLPEDVQGALEDAK